MCVSELNVNVNVWGGGVSELNVYVCGYVCELNVSACVCDL